MPRLHGFQLASILYSIYSIAEVLAVPPPCNGFHEGYVLQILQPELC